jgi:hypothetical protein
MRHPLMSASSPAPHLTTSGSSTNLQLLPHWCWLLVVFVLSLAGRSSSFLPPPAKPFTPPIPLPYHYYYSFSSPI